MVSINSFVLVPSELNGEAVQDSVHSAEFEVFENPEVNEKSEQVSLVSEGLISDVTSTEMCERLKDLLQENLELKDKLQRNNQVMDEQLNIIATWRDQIAKTNTKHRAMLEDLVFQNQKLQDEKAELENKVEELENPSNVPPPVCLECDSHKSRYSALEERLTQTLSEKENLAEELENSKQALEKSKQESLQSSCKFKETESLQLSPRRSTRSLVTIITDEESDFGIVIREDFPVQKKQARRSTSSLATIITDEESDFAIVIKEDFPVQKKPSRDDTVKEAKLHCESLQKKVVELSQALSEEKLKREHTEGILKEKEGELEELETARSKIESQDMYHLSLISALKEDGRKLSSSVHELQAFRDRCEKLEEQVKYYKTKLDELTIIKCEKEHLIKKLQQEIKSCTEKLNKEQIQTELHRKGLMAAEQNFVYLYEEQQQMVKRVKEQAQDVQPQGQQVTDEEALVPMLKIRLHDLDSLTAKLLDAEERLDLEEKKVIQLKREAKTLSEDSECIPILKAQVELYKAELESAQQLKNEIAARELSLSHEADDLKDQIKNLQEIIANQPHLQHRGSDSHVKSPGRGKHSRRSANQHKATNGSPDHVQQYSCPCCPLTFTDVNAVQNHVERCLTGSYP